MAVSQLERTVHRIGRLVAARGAIEGDIELLRAFSVNGDQVAFGEIVKRHGGLVRAVCRRVLGDRPGVDDTWQATFLVLARRASTVSQSGSLAGWLHGVIGAKRAFVRPGDDTWKAVQNQSANG